jgi:hypothetical protein
LRVTCDVELERPCARRRGQSTLIAAALFGGKTVPLALVGDTGMYRSAHGSGLVQVPEDVPNPADTNFTFYLT